MARGAQLNATDYAVLATAQRDVDTLGRIRTSSEVHGLEHRKRGHYLASLVRLEGFGFVRRSHHSSRSSWNTGTVTDAGRHYIGSNIAPVKRGAVGRYGHHGLAADGGTKFK